MKLIRLYSFRCPTAKSLPLENKSTLPPSQVFANGLLSPPPPLHLSLAEGIWIISARVNSCWDCTHPRGLRDKVWISKQYLGLLALPQKPRAAQGPDHSWPKILWVKGEPFTAAAVPSNTGRMRQNGSGGKWAFPWVKWSHALSLTSCPITGQAGAVTKQH